MISYDIEKKGSAIIPAAIVMWLFLLARTLPALPIHGLVTDTLGRGQPYASVELYEARRGELVYSIQADSAGYFHFPQVVEMEYQIRVTTQSFPPQWFSFYGNTLYRQFITRIGVASTFDTLFIIVTANPINNPADNKLAVLVTDSAGRALQNQWVYVSLLRKGDNYELPGQSSFSTDATVMFDTLQAASYAVLIRALNYPMQYYHPDRNTSHPKNWISIGGSGSYTLTVRMIDHVAGEGVIHGVCRSETDQPLDGITVELCLPGDTFRVVYRQTTGSDGVFSFVNIMESEYHLRLSGGGYPVQWYSMDRRATTRYPERAIWAMRSPYDTLLVRLSAVPVDNPATGLVTVTVRDSAGTHMTPPGSVLLVDVKTNSMYSPGFDSLSKSYIAYDIPAGEYLIELSFPPYPVQYYSPAGNTADRNYTFALKPNERIFFSAGISMTPGQKPSGVTGFVTGFVRDSLGGVRNALVTIYNSSFAIIQTAVTMENGSFKAIKLPVQEIYIGVQAAGYPMQYWSPRGMTTGRSLENRIYLVEGDSIFLDAYLVPFFSTMGNDTTIRQPVTAAIKGKVYDVRTGLPVCGARIVLFDFMPEIFDSRRLWSPWAAYTDTSGRFVIENVPFGNYRCMAEADSLNYVAQFYPYSDLLSEAKPFAVNSSAASMTVDFSLRKGGIIMGMVVDMNGAPLRDVNIDVRSTDNSRCFRVTTGVDGNYLISGVRWGTWEIWASHDAYLTVDDNRIREWMVTEGTTLQVPVFRMEKGGLIGGVFTSQIPLYDTAFGKNLFSGSVLLYKDTLRRRDETIRPEFSCPVHFSSTSPTGLSGTFRTGAVRPGAYSMVFTPHAQSSGRSAAATTASLLPGLGYSFVGSGSVFGMLPVTVINAADTIGNLTLSLRRGYSIFGRLLSENNTPLSGGYGVELLIKQDSLYIRAGCSAMLSDGRFELPGLIDNEEYYFLVWAEGYPSQYWSAGGNGFSPSEPYRFNAATYTPLQMTIFRNPGRIESWKAPEPITLWTEGDSLGFPLLVWNSDPSFDFERYAVYSSDRTGSVTRLAALPPDAPFTRYTFRDRRGGINFREYLVVGEGPGLVIRSNRIRFDPRSGTAASKGGLWLEVYNDRMGIWLEWGCSQELVFTEKDSINVYRSLGSETPRLLFRRSVWEKRIHDYSLERCDSGKTFIYYVELPSRQLVSPRVSKTLDAAFFALLARRLTVGPYEKYRRISEAIAAAADFDIIEVKAGTYIENISLGGKNLSINGSWDFGTPPVIDGGGSIAITVPYCKNCGEEYRARISGIAIRNSSIGIKSNAPIEVEECLFDNVAAAVSMSIDSSAMIQQIIADPFRSSLIEARIRHCTFIAKKPGSIVTTVTAIGSAEQPGYRGVYCGLERSYIIPTVSLSSSVNIELSSIAFYQSSGLQTTLPVTLQGNTSRVRFERCNIWKTSMEQRYFGIELVGRITGFDPQFSDSTWWFIAAASPLAGTAWDSRIGYDVRLLYSKKNRPNVVRNVNSVPVGLNAVLVRWSPSPAEENVVRYRIYRAPGDRSLFYVNEASNWDLKIFKDSIFKVVESFSTAATAFLDTTVKLGTPYLYVVVAVDKEGNEGEVRLPAPPDIATYFVNVPTDRTTLSAGKWQMIGVQGASDIVLNSDTRHVLFGWDDAKMPDKTLGQYNREFRMLPAKGYWFKPALDTVINMDAASLISLKSIESSIGINLVKGATGWNLVSSPFPFTLTPEWLGDFIAWEWDADSLGYRKVQALRPWKAYWVYTDRDTVLRLWKKQPLAYYLSRPLAKAANIPTLWKLQLALRDEKSWDTDNFIGVVTASLNKSQRLATPEPPAAFNAARLYVIDPEAAGSAPGRPEQCAHLFKTVPNPATKVEWIVGIGPSESVSKLDIKGTADLPEKLFAFWVEAGRIIDIRKQPSIEIAPHAQELSGCILVTANPGDLALYAGQLTVMKPYPNPFNRNATIQYVLPYEWAKNGSISEGGKHLLNISLYDITGKKVITLVNESRSPGIYRTVWNGENASGDQVPAGMYVMRLRYGEREKTARLYRIR